MDENTPFLSALMEALGLAGKRADPTGESSTDSDTSDGLASLLSMLSTAGEEGTEAPAEGTETTDTRSSSDSSRFSRPTAAFATGRGEEGWAERTAGQNDAVGAAPVDLAAAAAAGAAAVTGTSDVRFVDPSLDGVAPALRERIERVIERMQDEFGHEVSVVEGYRSPERQAHLYEQGRTRPGEITTWTQRSWHSEGLAADLMVDGGYDDRLAYARLQRVAREEGLRTLGSRDMGHVELPSTGTAQDEAAPLPIGGRRFVGVATPAAVAVPAAPAPVASVAAVAMPGQWVTEPTAEPASRSVPVEAEAALDDSQSNTGREAARRPDPAMRSDFAAQVADAGFSKDTSGRAAGAVEGAGEARSAEQAARVAELRAMTETAQPSRVSLRIDGPGGDQVRVGLLDRSIDASLDISDPERANAMRAGVAELHKALEARGLELGALSVNGAASAQGPASWFGGATDPASELIRTLLSGGSGGSGNDGRGGERQSAEERMNHRGGSEQNRSRRDSNKERGK